MSIEAHAHFDLGRVEDRAPARAALDDAIRSGPQTAWFRRAHILPTGIWQALAQRDVTVTVNAAVGTLLDMSARGLDVGVVRASPHCFVTTEQPDQAVLEIAGLR